MRILIDTNIFISREEAKVLRKDLSRLLSVLSELNNTILIHPESVQDLSRDKDDKRKEIQLSKLDAYTRLENPPDPKGDTEFENVFGNIGEIKNEHEIVDLKLLYSIKRNAVSFLITEDKDLHKKAEKINLRDQTFYVNEALEYFQKKLQPTRIASPPALLEVPMHNVDLKDQIFNDLRKEYEGFDYWWARKSSEGRKAWIFKKNGKLGALLVYKRENEIVESTKPLPKKERLKISTLKVSHTGQKIGELLIKTSISFAVENKLDQIYLTHFIVPNDYLVQLLQEYGFYDHGMNDKGEAIFVKDLIPNASCKTPLELLKLFYPSFYSGERVSKFIIPIQPIYHERLFTDFPRRQLTLDESGGGLITEGNTIKKAYLCNSRNKKISNGDIILFYRSVDNQQVTSIGVVDNVYHDLTDANQIRKLVGKRTVYSDTEIEQMSQKPTKVIMFYFIFHLPNKIDLHKLKEEAIIPWNPVSITEISHSSFSRTMELSGLDKKFVHESLEFG